MTCVNVSARRAARIAAVTTAAVLMLGAAPAGAARNTPFESLCGRNVTGLVLVAGQSAHYQHGCVIHIRAGGVLRISGSDINSTDRLHLRLYGKGAVELRDTTLSHESLAISGDGSVSAVNSALIGFRDANIDVTGDIELDRANLDGGGAGLRSSDGRIGATDSTLNGRGGFRVRARRAVSLLWSTLQGGTGSAGIEVGEGGDLSVIASVLSGPAVRLSSAGAASSITLTGSDVTAFREPFDWPSDMLPPARCSAGDNLPEIPCPFDPEELPDAPSGPRP